MKTRIVCRRSIQFGVAIRSRYVVQYRRWFMWHDYKKPGYDGNWTVEFETYNEAEILQMKLEKLRKISQAGYLEQYTVG